MNKFQILVMFSILIFLALVTGVLGMCYCFFGHENEYTEIRDDDEADADLEMASKSQEPEAPVETASSVQGRSDKTAQSTPAKNMNTKPTTVAQSPADVLAQEIDYFVRHMDHFYATGFYCSILVLEHKMGMMDRVKSKTLRDFVRSRPEFKMRSNLLSFKLVNLTPFREPGIQVAGKFQCINVACNHSWTCLNTYADHYQLCPQCSARVYPFEQQPLTKAQLKEIYTRGEPAKENYYDPAEVDHARNCDSLDVLSHIHSPVKPVLSGYQAVGEN